MADCEVVDAPPKFKSRVWQYFGFENIIDNNGIRTLDKSKTVCKQCRAQNSWQHNQYVHLSAEKTPPPLPRYLDLPERPELPERPKNNFIAK